ncbi:MAG: hypothetical protein HZA77_12875 [Candidatus Schekmanbacteria bacterium]|nr:hypothetical protein [Candidatus Schekmanbacteria bacterium]
MMNKLTKIVIISLIITFHSLFSLNAYDLNLIYAYGGAFLDIKVSGNYAYASTVNGLKILDISEPSSPVLTGAYVTSTAVAKIDVADGKAYLASDSEGIFIIDVTNPTSPSLLGTYGSSGEFQKLYISGDILYVADNDNGLLIIDVSNPSAPTLEGSYEETDYVFDVYVSGTTAFLAAFSDGLLIIDVTNPASPSLLGTYNTTSFDPVSVQVAGTFAYLVSDYGLKIIDVSNPADPSPAGSYSRYNEFSDVNVSGTKAYINEVDQGMLIIDVSNPSAPSFLGIYEETFMGSIFIGGDTAYITSTDTGGFIIVDAGNPESPELAGEYNESSMTSEIYGYGNVVYIFGALNGMGIMDVSNPLTPVFSGIYEREQFNGKADFYKNRVFLCLGESGFEIVDLSKASEPRHIVTYNDYPAADISVDGDKAYIVTNVYDDFKMIIVDVSHIKEPDKIGSYKFEGDYVSVSTVYVTDDIAYVTGIDEDHNEDDFLEVLDVSSPGDITRLGYYYNFGRIFSVKGHKGYGAEGKEFFIADVTDPGTIQKTGTYSLDGYISDIHVEGRLAYVTCYDESLFAVLDVKDPKTPVLLYSYETTGTPLGISVTGNTVYVADGGGGVKVFGISDTLANPLISQISSNKGTYDNKITISGSGFGEVEGKVVLKSGDEETDCGIVKWGNEEIKVSLPWGVNPGKCELFVISSNGVRTEDGIKFKYLKPAPAIKHITPKSAGIGEEVIITGENFGPAPGSDGAEGTKLLVTGGSASVVSWGNESITVMIDNAKNKQMGFAIRTKYGKSKVKKIKVSK